MNTDKILLKIPIKSLSIQEQLEQKLLNLLINSELCKVALSSLKQNSRSLSRLSQVTPIIYRWAIAMQLSRQSSVSPLDLAEQIVSSLVIHRDEYQQFPQLTFSLKLVEPGWLDFQLCDRALAIWLDYCLQAELPQLSPKNQSIDPDHLFSIQSAYARSCSLLRLGEQQGLIKLNNPNFNDLVQLYPFGSPIPWLIGGKTCRLTHPTELALISQIITTVDRIKNDSTWSGNQLTSRLSHFFWNFERFCRIFGEVAQEYPALAQGRLGLVAVSQRLLQWLWYSQMGTFPRSHL
ncbi:hypothetical protein PCC8801_3849 [Rippkaea orientalis PCC 8801]|uniref:DALR anticodon binding domain protein n=1 Tax=Rippkaea orientalis (strain PCC 8801 / RF-1) TaxID=41431 RepID=B7K493_RIPO1|nr:hypothetical protein [Rippkaea orientalis]ACK67799.1 hypothetical protein PCC8801_3849 [Rippkaea orientalis PCC 8801]